MAHKTIVVKAAWDSEARVWFVEESDLPGLNVEAETLETLIEKLPGAILDLLEDDASGEYRGARELAVEVVARASTTVRRFAAA